MAKTYLQAINEVHGFLRRDDTGTGVSSLTADADTLVIAKFINEAKRRVEGVWKWNALRTTITFSSTASTFTYDTSNAGIAVAAQTNDRSELLTYKDGSPLFWDVTTANAGFKMTLVPRDWALNEYRQAQFTVSMPDRVAVYRSGNGLSVLFPVAPTDVRNYSFEVYKPQDELTATGDLITAPWRPIVLLATALAAGERGDQFGVDPGTYLDMYAQAIEEEMAFDKTEGDDDALEPV
jgi:hypothetical protein